MTIEFPPIRLGVLGVGNMGGVIVGGVRSAELLPPGHVIVCDLDAARVAALRDEHGVAVAANPAELAALSDVIVLAVKPQGIGAVLEALGAHLDPARHTLVSVAAGVPIARLASALPDGLRIVRVMPNTPALVGAGMTAISRGPAAADADVDLVETLFSTVGAVVRVEERHMDAVTAVSGSGPAYLFLCAESLAEAALEVGLPDDIVETLVTHTLLGAATLLAESDEPAATLRARVTSPGGTTEAALQAFEAAGFRDAWSHAVAAATRRGAELAKLV